MTPLTADGEPDAFELARERDEALAEAAGMRVAARTLSKENAALRAQCRALAQALHADSRAAEESDSVVDVLLRIANDLAAARSDALKAQPSVADLRDFLEKTETRLRLAGWKLVQLGHPA